MKNNTKRSERRETNKEYREINSVSNRIAFEEINNLVERKILVKKGKGRSVYYAFR